MRPGDLTRILQLASQALPIGGYSHSQGLESAIEHRVVWDEASVLDWILGGFEFSMATFEVPCLLAMIEAWSTLDADRVNGLNKEFVASRESAETRAATLQMGYSLRALLDALPDFPAAPAAILRTLVEPCLPCVWGAACAAWRIDPRDSAVAYAWSWAENQVLVAVKTLPMGQSAGQRILSSLGRSIERRWDGGTFNCGDERSAFAPALAILCARHETQYSRLFRS